MQKVKLKREIISNKAVLGSLELEGKEIAKTLENPWLNNEPFISCIPVGEYKATKDDTGKFRYWKVLNVECRGLIEIHNGNVESETEGCILVGRKWGFLGENIAVLDSRNTLDKLRSILDDEFLLNITE